MDTHTPATRDISVLTDLGQKGMTGVTDSRKCPSSAGLGRHTLCFQGVTASPLGVTD